MYMKRGHENTHNSGAQLRACSRVHPPRRTPGGRARRSEPCPVCLKPPGGLFPPPHSGRRGWGREAPSSAPREQTQ